MVTWATLAANPMAAIAPGMPNESEARTVAMAVTMLHGEDDPQHAECCTADDVPLGGVAGGVDQDMGLVFA